MKNVFLISFILITSIKVSAQNFLLNQTSSVYQIPGFIKTEKKKTPEIDYKNVVSIYPFRAIASYLMAGVETKISGNKALKFIAGYATFEGSSNTLSSNIEMISFDALRLELQYKYFIGKSPQVFNGFYFSPNTMYKMANYKYYAFNSLFTEVSAQAQAFMIGFNIGYQVPIGDRISLDGYVGQSILWSSGNYTEIKDRLGDTYTNSIGIQAGFSFGIGF